MQSGSGQRRHRACPPSPEQCQTAEQASYCTESCAWTSEPENRSRPSACLPAPIDRWVFPPVHSQHTVSLAPVLLYLPTALYCGPYITGVWAWQADHDGQGSGIFAQQVRLLLFCLGYECRLSQHGGESRPGNTALCELHGWQPCVYFFFVPFVVKGICTWAVEKLWFTFELFTHTLAFRSVQCVEFYRFEDYYTKLLPLLR